MFMIRGIIALERKLERLGEKVSKKILPESIGLPNVIHELVKLLLDESNKYESGGEGFNLTIIRNDLDRLVDNFTLDASVKKHYAVPINSTFSKELPVIGHGIEVIDVFNNKEHRKLLDRFPFFTNTQTMPKYAFSAYELISRDLESIYLHIPSYIGVGDVQVPIEKDNWKKRHLYVLMTRAKLNLVINVEDEMLFTHFKNMTSLHCLQGVVNLVD